MHVCPHTDCAYHGWLEMNNWRANGHPNGGPWRQFHCPACDSYCPEPPGTIFHGKQTAVELIVRVLACLAEGLGIRATAQVFEVAPKTVLQWLAEAAEQVRAFAASFLCHLRLEQLHLDELDAVLRAFKAGESTEDDAIERLERSPSWGWTAMDPTSKLLVGVDVGCRPLAMAQRVVHQVAKVRAPGCVPLSLTDGLKDYGTALLTQCGWTINTAFVERLNLDIRQCVATIGRRVNTLCQGEVSLQDQLTLFQVYHNVVLPHASLRQRLPFPEATSGSGSAKVWRPCTPAMAAGLSDHVWSLKEVLLYRVPPWPQPQVR
jgi:hypothetical protein